MGGQQWTAIASLIISVFALLVAAGSALIAWLNYRRGVSAVAPTAFANVIAVQGQPGWYKVVIRIDNHSARRLIYQGTRFERPRGIKVLDTEDAFHRPNINTLVNPLPIDKAVDIVTRAVAIKPSGNEVPIFHGMRMGPGHDHDETLFVLIRSSIWSRGLRMRVMLLSLEPVERRCDIVIKRTLPAHNSTATD